VKIILNGAARETAAATLAALLDEQGFGTSVATAVNEAFVAKAARATATLAEGDRIEVLSAMQGG